MDILKEADFIFYRGEDGNVHAQVIAGNGTVWATQNTIAEIFGIDRTGIGKHLKNIFEEGELIENSVSAKIAHTANDGKEYKTTFYNLEAILSVGYRVSSYKATKFRQWSNRITNEYLLKGFVMDDERLKQGNKLFGKDHFKELLERVREIRASERMFYEKVLDLYALSEDYDKIDPSSREFFKKVQAKLEYAITGKTPSELLYSRIDSKLPYMGLKTWKAQKKGGKLILSDVKVAKNAMTDDELKSLNTLVSAFLDHAEMLYDKQKIMKMDDWVKRLDRFLEFNEYKVLKDGGSIKRELADKYVEKEFEKFRVYQDENYKSDFNNFVDNLRAGSPLPSEEELYQEENLDEPLPFDTEEPLSDFNQKLNKALNFTPPNKVVSKPIITKPKNTKKCPRCGAFIDKKLNYCNNDIVNDNGDVVACGYSFGAIKGNDSWD